MFTLTCANGRLRAKCFWAPPTSAIRRTFIAAQKPVSNSRPRAAPSLNARPFQRDVDAAATLAFHAGILSFLRAADEKGRASILFRFCSSCPRLLRALLFWRSYFRPLAFTHTRLGRLLNYRRGVAGNLPAGECGQRRCVISRGVTVIFFYALSARFLYLELRSVLVRRG